VRRKEEKVSNVTLLPVISNAQINFLLLSHLGNHFKVFAVSFLNFEQAQL